MQYSPTFTWYELSIQQMQNAFAWIKMFYIDILKERSGFFIKYFSM